MERQERTVPFNVALRPRTFPRAFPPARRVIEAYQAQLIVELRGVDQEAVALAARREAVVAELRRCREACGWQDMGRRKVPLPPDVDAVPEGTVPLEGADLRDAVVAAVEAAARPVRLTEIHRMLLAWGVHPVGRPAQALSNALRGPCASGVVVRVARGVYSVPLRSVPQ